MLYGDWLERVKREERRHLYVVRAELTQFLEEQRDSAVRRGESDPAFGAGFQFTQHTNELLGRPIHKAAGVNPPPPPPSLHSYRRRRRKSVQKILLFFNIWLCVRRSPDEIGKGGGVCRGGM